MAPDNTQTDAPRWGASEPPPSVVLSLKDKFAPTAHQEEGIFGPDSDDNAIDRNLTFAFLGRLPRALCPETAQGPIDAHR